MSTRIKDFNKDIIEWAIIRSGNNLDDFYAHNPNVLKWVEKDAFPTIKQLEAFTNKVYIPFGYIFLDTPPQENLSLPFFRKGKDKDEKVSLNVFHTVQIIQERQDWLTEYLDELDFTELDFVGKYNEKSNYLDIVNDIREILQLDVEWANKCSSWEMALNYLTSLIEDIGIVVTFNGIVGNNTRRPLNVEECRGFVLVNKKAPFLFINSADAKSAQVFTIMHELAHIWLGESAGFDNKNLIPADDPIELLCDKVAAELLVPETLFIDRWRITKDFKNLSKIFKVSPIVIARRALDLDFITKTDFFSFYNSYMQNFINKEKKKNSGGDFYAVARKRISLRFASFVNSAVRENKLLYRDAYKLTNLKGDTYNKFINTCLYQ